MIHIERGAEPDFWSDYKRKNPKITYDELDLSDEGKNIRQQIREYNIEQQHGLCAYCCKGISVDTSINEHMKPRGVPQYSSFSMEYDNLVACCKSEGEDSTCSASKGNKYDGALFVSPLDVNCESYFEYYPNGEVVSDSPKGQYMIDLLNLNSLRLKRARLAQLKVCEAYHNADLVRKLFLTPDADNRLQQFIDIIKYFDTKFGWQ